MQLNNLTPEETRETLRAITAQIQRVRNELWWRISDSSRSLKEQTIAHLFAAQTKIKQHLEQQTNQN